MLTMPISSQRELFIKKTRLRPPCFGVERVRPREHRGLTVPTLKVALDRSIQRKRAARIILASPFAASTALLGVRGSRSHRLSANICYKLRCALHHRLPLFPTWRLSRYSVFCNMKGTSSFFAFSRFLERVDRKLIEKWDRAKGSDK